MRAGSSPAACTKKRSSLSATPFLDLGGALRFLFRLVLPHGKTTGFDRTTNLLQPAISSRSKPGFKSLCL